MSDIFEDPPDDNEQYESLDEALDEEDLPGHGGGPEGGRDLDADLIVDRTELQEVGADLDDPERISLLDGGIDDPDGSGPPTDHDDVEAGWDVDPLQADPRFGGQSDAGADGDAVTDDVLVDIPDLETDPELVDTDATDFDRFPDDAPGPDSAR